MNNYFIFDTNTLLSALFNEGSTAGLALKRARISGTLLVSDEIVAEYVIVFSREKFNRWVKMETRIDFIENIISNSISINPAQTITACRDPKDDKYLSLAVSAQASCIITGDKDLLVLHPFDKIPILNPTDFLTVYK
ncbi:putative toxin-antitoxin system toxin component, PIN family [Olivibacter sp. 47]|jgi:putative PIN family toxin of toxin-antitoxin system|nr:putative toxin-antitoxin system toxin component, PIN family [Olivibacter sp. 47]MDM8173124.1 putative toxin-antitoxin system toxin component, PIN family [Olivibacter sp. 47]